MTTVMPLSDVADESAAIEYFDARCQVAADQ